MPPLAQSYSCLLQKSKMYSRRPPTVESLVQFVSSSGFYHLKPGTMWDSILRALSNFPLEITPIVCQITL